MTWLTIYAAAALIGAPLGIPTARAILRAADAIERRLRPTRKETAE